MRLPNGLRVLLKRHANLPLVNIQAFVLGGSLVDSVETAGRASLVGAMLDMGTADHSARQIAEYFDSIGGQLQHVRGAFHRATAALRHCEDDFPAAAALFAECFTRPTFPQEEFAKVQQLAWARSPPRRRSATRRLASSSATTCRPARPITSSRAARPTRCKKLTATDLQKYHAKYFVPNNMVVTVFGDIDPDKALALVKKQFGSLKPAPELPPISFDRPNAIAKTVVRHKRIGKETAMVWFGYPTAGILQKEDYAAMTVLGAVMAGYHYPGGWLHNELRGEGLVYSVHAMQTTGPVPGYFDIVAQSRPDKLDEVVGRIEQQR